MTNCKAITQKGDRCKNTSHSGHLCRVHAGKKSPSLNFRLKGKSKSRSKTRKSSPKVRKSSPKTRRSSPKAKSRKSPKARSPRGGSKARKSSPKPKTHVPTTAYPLFTPRHIPPYYYQESGPVPFHKTEQFARIMKASKRRVDNFVKFTRENVGKVQSIGVEGLKYIEMMNVNGFITIESGQGIPCVIGKQIKTPTGVECNNFYIKHAQVSGFMAKSLIPAFQREMAQFNKYQVSISTIIPDNQQATETTLEIDYCLRDGKMDEPMALTFPDTIKERDIRNSLYELVSNAGYGEGDMGLNEVSPLNFALVGVADIVPCRDGVALFRDVATVLEKINH